MMLRRVLCLALVASSGTLVLGQGPTPGPAFEVASIKRNVSGGPALGRTEPGGRFTATSAPVLQFIRMAYDLTSDRILNAPDWVMSEHYDLVAKAPEGNPPRTMGPLMQSLLRDRFGLVAHFETRDMPIYELVLARQDGRLGPKLQQASCNCGGAKAEPGCRERPPSSVPELDGLACALLGVRGRMFARGFPLSTIFQNAAGRPVVDKTGLMGPWNLELEFMPDEPPQGPTSAFPPPPSADAPSFFTALQEQLGLKMQSARGPVQVLVIDHIERPTPD